MEVDTEQSHAWIYEGLLVNGSVMVGFEIRHGNTVGQCYKFYPTREEALKEKETFETMRHAPTSE